MSETQDLLFELGCEELPPTTLLRLSKALQQSVEKGLNEVGLEHGEVHPYATPRRLALWIEAVTVQQPDQQVERRGPALKAAYDDQGQPSKAVLGFLRGCGPSVTIDQLETLKTNKGEWLIFRRNEPGQPARELIPTIIDQALAALPIAKRMRWGDHNDEFVRPVHWAVLQLGNQAIEHSVLGIATDQTTRGHRFHAPSEIQLGAAANYADKLQLEGKVIADFATRRAMIEAQVVDAATSVSGVAQIDADLLDEVTALVEWPVAVVGGFETRFLSLPKEALVTSMQSHQKYFPVCDVEGALLPYFVTVSNIESSNPSAVRHGNERVIRPRLADAEFFWGQDRKRSLYSRVSDLENIVFQKTLGTLRDKTRRLEYLCDDLARLLDANRELAVRAAQLSKTDLLTHMVSEFASLQGTMGRYYAIADQEPKEVALALQEQYFPKQAGSALPDSVNGQILAIADKIDTIVGIFSVGLVPTGDKDPYALRRAAIGLLRILIEKNLDLDLQQLIESSCHQMSHAFDKEQVQQQVLSFILDRLKGYCLAEGFTADQFEAVARVKPTQPTDFQLRLQAVQAFSQQAESESLAAANKRIQNLLRKSAQGNDLNTQELSSLVEPAETALLEALQTAENDIAPLLKKRDYANALQRLSALREPVDRFFDDILVMSEDQSLRQTRLALLQRLQANFTKIADISII